MLFSIEFSQISGISQIGVVYVAISGEVVRMWEKNTQMENAPEQSLGDRIRGLAKGDFRNFAIVSGYWNITRMVFPRDLFTVINSVLTKVFSSKKSRGNIHRSADEWKKLAIPVIIPERHHTVIASVEPILTKKEID